MIVMGETNDLGFSPDCWSLPLVLLWASPAVTLVIVSIMSRLDRARLRKLGVAYGLAVLYYAGLIALQRLPIPGPTWGFEAFLVFSLLGPVLSGSIVFLSWGRKIKGKIKGDDQRGRE